ncbi:unnamed protein product [Arabidopsis arenosa]|uniref:protein-serine/threonine phosphatase n=1 Tax=Arabidopsis arenosa TaxID=38785 RepID=A0A8S2AYP5_ARAAE|nr:unnamed protein product [Arabidopsis arenosa]
MLRALARPLERCLGSRASGDGLLWQSELRPHAGGDYSIAVVQANSRLEDQSQVFTSSSATYVGVYDGHGGPEASRFVNRHLFPYMHKFAREHGGLSVDVIKKAFKETEEEFCGMVKRSLPTKPQMATVGSCCLVGAISNDTLYVANLGDSRAVLGSVVSGDDSNKGAVAERLSTDHNVAVEEVRKEVKALNPDDSQIVIYTRGVWRIKGIIQVSRSIGDVYLKKPEYYRDPIFQRHGNPIPLRRPAMTAEPSIIVRKLKPQDLFLIFASDGLWEHLSDETAVEIVLKHPRTGIARRLVRAALEEAAKKREMRYGDIKKIAKGIRRHFHDDISVVVVYLDQKKTSSSNGKLVQQGGITAPPDIYSLHSDEAEQRRKSKTMSVTLSVADAVWSNIESTGSVTEEQLSILHLLFGKNLEKATRIIDKRGVKKISGLPSGRSIFQVVGESQKREEYLCFPGDYCGCYSFFYDVVSRGEHQCCKHQLAARLASSLGTYSEIEVSDDHLALMLSKI